MWSTGARCRFRKPTNNVNRVYNILYLAKNRTYVKGLLAKSHEQSDGRAYQEPFKTKDRKPQRITQTIVGDLLGSNSIEWLFAAKL